MNKKASHSIRVGTTAVVFVTRILKCSDVGSLVNPGCKYNGQQAYRAIDATMHTDEKELIECKGCARNCRICQRAWLMTPVSQENFTYKLLKRPKLQLRLSLKVFLKIKFEINVITYPTAINLSFLYRTCRCSWLSVTATTGTEWLVEPNMAVGRAIGTTPTRLTTVTLLSRCILREIRIKFTYILQRPLDAKIFYLKRAPIVAV